MEYKLMNRYELTEYIVDFWSNWGTYNVDDRDFDDLYEEIYDNLNSMDGIEQELDVVRDEFAKGFSKDSEEYKKLDELWNYINWYKTAFGKGERIIELLYKWVGNTYLESYDDYAYLDFLYKDLNMCVMWETGKGVRVSETYEIYDKERKGYIVEDFLTTEDYVGMLNRTREENLQDLVASLKYFDSKNLQIAYKEQEKKVINFLKENW